MAPTKPSLELLRSLSDEHVLRALMAQRRATRAEIAAATGLSKPTVSESVRRLSDAGAVVDTGERTTGRGRVGTYYALPADAGRALASSIAPEGIVAEAVDVYGDVVARAAGAPRRRPAQVARRAARASPAGRRRPSGSPSSAPPTRWTARPGGWSSCPTRRSWSASSTRPPCSPTSSTARSSSTTTSTGRPAPSSARGADDFAYLFLGEGLGCAVVSDGEVRRGHAGLAGEIAHLVTAGPDGAAMPLTEVFAALGLRRPGSTAIDVAGAAARASDDRATRWPARSAACCRPSVALADPAVVVLGGAVGPGPGARRDRARVRARARAGCRSRPPRSHDEPALAGAREAALAAAARRDRRRRASPLLEPGPAPEGSDPLGSL